MTVKGWHRFLVLFLLLWSGVDGVASRCVTLENRCTPVFRTGVSRARYYNPGTGRFWTADNSEQGSQEDPKSLHLYNYCEGDPLNNVDPSGHDIGEMLSVMDVGFTLFAVVSPGTATGKAKAEQVSRTGTIWFKIGFDSSVRFTDNYKNKIRRSLDRLDTVLSQNCRKWGILWLGNVKTTFDWHHKPSPKGGAYTGNEDFSNGFGISGHAGGIPLLATKLGITSGQWRAVTEPGVAILYNIDQAVDTTIAHETGHYAGYKPPKPDTYDHSDDPTNIMGVGEDERVNADKDYCEKVTKLAK